MQGNDFIMHWIHGKMIAVFALCLITSNFAATHAQGTLSDNIRIESAHLGYSLQYRVYTPEGINDLSEVPTIYMTDGQGYIRSGKMVRELDEQIRKGKIKPVIAVFVDPRDPDNLRNNRRNQQFFCNTDYVQFFTRELVPTISNAYPVSEDREDRVILGLSFGGLNAACFGLLAHPTFGGIAMQSPATHPVPILFDLYESEETRPVKIYFSTGTKNDNTAAARRFRKILGKKGYEMLYKEVPEGHTWRNWRPLLDDILIYFFAKN